MYLLFRSDVTEVRDGFVVSFSWGCNCPCGTTCDGGNCQLCTAGGMCPSNSPADCHGHGLCTDGLCQCYNNASAGHWDGAFCEACQVPYNGTDCNQVIYHCTPDQAVLVTARSGLIVSGSTLNPSGPYSDDLVCRWVLTAPLNEGGSLHLSLDVFETEEDYDILEVYHNYTNGSRLAHRLSGNYSATEIVSPAGTSVKLVFVSDNSVVGPGFQISFRWETDGPPKPSLDLACSVCPCGSTCDADSVCQPCTAGGAECTSLLRPECVAPPDLTLYAPAAVFSTDSLRVFAVLHSSGAANTTADIRLTVIQVI